MAQTNGKENTKLKIGPAVGAFANGLFEARAFEEGQEPKYGITLLFPKKMKAGSPEAKSFEALKAMINKVAIQKAGPNYAKLPKFGLPIRDGDVEKPDRKEFAGMWFVAAKSKNRPQIVNRHLVHVTDKDEAYSGCKFVASVGVFAFEKKGVKGVALGLNNVMLWEKGERIDGRIDAAEDFAEYEGGAEAGGAEGGGEEESALD